MQCIPILIKFYFSFISKINEMKQNEVHWKAVSHLVAQTETQTEAQTSHNLGIDNKCSAPGVFLLLPHHHQQQHWCSSPGYYYLCITKHHCDECSGPSLINWCHQQWTINWTQEVINYHIFFANLRYSSCDTVVKNNKFKVQQENDYEIFWIKEQIYLLLLTIYRWMKINRKYNSK